MKVTPIAAVISTTDEPEIKDQLSAILLTLHAMFEKMPMPHQSGRLNVDISQSSSQSQYNTWFTNAVSNTGTGAVYFLSNQPWNLADAGAARLYSQISVA